MITATIIGLGLGYLGGAAIANSLPTAQRAPPAALTASDEALTELEKKRVGSVDALGRSDIMPDRVATPPHSLPFETTIVQPLRCDLPWAGAL
jgi:hypothetical protein